MQKRGFYTSPLFSKYRFVSKKKPQIVRPPSIVINNNNTVTDNFEKTEGYFDGLLYLPFNIKWKIMLSMAILFSCFINLNIFLLEEMISQFPLKESDNTEYWIVEVLCVAEIFYISDLILLTLHRSLKELRCTRVFNAKSKLYLVSGYITLIPSLVGIFQCIYSERFLPWLRLFVLIRLYRNFLVYKYLMRSTYLSKFIIILTTLTMICSSIAVATFTFIIYVSYIAKKNNVTTKEAISIVVPLMDRRVLKSWSLDSKMDFLLWAYFVAGTCLIGRSPIYLYQTNILTVLINQGWMLITLITKMSTIGIFASIIVTEYRRNFQFSAEKEIIKMKMNKMELAKKTYNAVLKWYNMIWSVSEGITDNNEVCKLLPSGLYQYCCLDMYCTVLKHSNIFRNVNFILAATISTAMETYFYCPGDVVLKRGMIKSEMIYIQSGVVHITSVFDDSSPIIKLFPGTCFGEASLFVSYPVRSKIVCATYCELKILRKNQLYNLFKKYPREIRQMQGAILKRYEKANLLSAMREIHHSEIIGSIVGIHEDESLKRIKRIARVIDRSFSKSQDKLDLEDIMYKILNQDVVGENIKPDYIGSCCDYIDCYVISESDSDKEKKIHVKSSCPVILHPNSPIIHLWNVLINLGIIYMIFTIPFEVGFGVPVNNFHYKLSIFIQIFFVIDVISQSIFAVVTQDSIIETPSEILQYRMKRVEYKADIMGSIPFNFFLHIGRREISWSTWGYSKMNYIVRTWRIIRFCEECIKKSFNYREQVLLFTLSFYFICFLLFWSVIFGSLSCYNNYCNPKAMWIMLEGTIENRVNAVYITLTTTLNVLLLCLGIGGGYVIPFTVSEHIMYLIMSGTFLFFDIFVIASTYAVVVQSKSFHEVKKDKVNQVLNLITKYNLTSDLVYRIFREIRLQKLLHNTEWLEDSKQAPNLPNDLMKELKMSTWINILLNVPLFANTEKKFLNEVLDSCTSTVLPPNEVIVYSGIILEYIYLIKNGYVQIIGHKSQEFEGVKGPGWCFGILEALMEIPMMKTIKTETSCECLTINKSQLFKILKKYPEYDEEVKRTVQKCEALANMPVVEGIISMQFCKSENKQFFHHISYGKIVDLKAETEFLKPFGKYRFLSYFLLHSVILPSSNVIWTLEVIRSIFALINCICVPPKMLFLHRSDYFAIMFNFLDVVAYIDIYLRLHVAYYNEAGLLITHPLMTAIHYLKTSFFVDMVACFPLDHVFGMVTSYSKYWLNYNKVIQIHRLLGLLNHINKRKIIQSPTIQSLKLFIVLLVVMNVLSSISFISACVVSKSIQVVDNDVKWDGVKCPDLVYNDFIFGKHVTPRKMYLYFQFYTTILLNQVNCVHKGWVMNGGLLKLLICTIGYILVTNMSSRVSALTCLQNTGLKFQQKVKQLMKFLQESQVPIELRNEFSVYYNALWEQHRGTNPKLALHIVNKTLEGDIIYHIYGSFLKDYTIFAKSSTTFFRSLLVLFDIQIFHKDSFILSEEYVHGKVYLLYSGYVTIITGRRPVMKLNKGSFFGNLYNTPLTQQTVSVLANTTVEVLVSKSCKLHEILNAYPHYKNEFVNSLNKHANQGLCVINSIISLDEELEDNNLQSKKYIKKQKISVKKDNYFLKPILALLSSLTTLYTIATHEFTLPAIFIMFIFDLITLLTIIMNCYTPFLDAFGDYEKDLIKIKKNYRKQKYGFWFDIMTTFPLECLWFLFEDRRLAYLELRFNRILRYILFWFYLRKHLKQISSKQFLARILGSLIHFYCFLYVSTSLFLTIYLHFETDYVEFSSYMRLDQFLRMLSILFSDFTHYSHELLIHFNNNLILFRILQMTLTTVVTAVMMGYVMFYIETAYFDILRYLEKKKTILHILKSQHIGIYLYKVVDDYLRVLWDFDYGCQQPEILSLAPISLQQKLMKVLYEKHLINHFIFKDCLKSFRDQVILHLSRERLFPGSVIITENTKDDSMYFVHEGVVQVYKSNEDEETFVGVLFKHDSFGTNQGLTIGVPHTNTYKAYTTVIIVKLCFSSWSYLLNYYPAEKTRIYRILHEGHQ